jgi:hypothetical protein
VFNKPNKESQVAIHASNRSGQSAAHHSENVDMLRNSEVLAKVSNILENRCKSGFFLTSNKVRRSEINTGLEDKITASRGYKLPSVIV